MTTDVVKTIEVPTPDDTTTIDVVETNPQIPVVGDDPWERVDAARLMLGWSESRIGTELLGNRTGYTKVRERGWSSHGGTLKKVVDGLVHKYGFSREWILLGKGPPGGVGGQAPSHWGSTRRELAMRVLVFKGGDPEEVESAAERVLAMYGGRRADGSEPMTTMVLTSWITHIRDEIAKPRDVPGVPVSSLPTISDPMREDATEILVRRGYKLGRAIAAVRAVAGYEPPRTEGQAAATASHLARLAEGILKAEDAGDAPQPELLLGESAGPELERKLRPRTKKSREP